MVVYFHRNNHSKKYKGFFAGIYTRFANSDSKIQVQKYAGFNDYDDVEFIDNTLGFGGTGGYQLYIKDKLSIEFLLGFGSSHVLSREFIKKSDHFSSSLKAIPDGRLSLNLGYKF